MTSDVPIVSVSANQRLFCLIPPLPFLTRIAIYFWAYKTNEGLNISKILRKSN